jgi:hypothetical protein
MSRILLVSTAAWLLLACGGAPKPDGVGPLMNPGVNCLTCHSTQGEAAEEAFSIAGTVFGDVNAKADGGVSGVTVLVTDGNGVEIALTSNAAGNFYTKASVTRPLRKAAVVRDGQKTEMSAVPPSGACNGCHAQPPAQGAPGRLYAP